MVKSNSISLAALKAGQPHPTLWRGWGTSGLPLILHLLCHFTMPDYSQVQQGHLSMFPWLWFYWIVDRDSGTLLPVHH